MNQCSNNIASELSIYDDLMMAGEHLANKAHDMEVMRRYMGLKTQLEEKIVDEQYESVIFLRNAYLFEGLSIAVFIVAAPHIPPKKTAMLNL